MKEDFSFCTSRYHTGVRIASQLPVHEVSAAFLFIVVVLHIYPSKQFLVQLLRQFLLRCMVSETTA